MHTLTMRAPLSNVSDHPSIPDAINKPKADYYWVIKKQKKVEEKDSYRSGMAKKTFTADKKV